LRRVLTLGKAEGDEQEVLGFVSDAAFGPNGSVYVADAAQQRILAYDSTGRLLRALGRSGQGPGEFLLPWSLVVVADTLFVYDSRQGRISVLDTTGAFHRSFPPPSTFMRHIRAGPQGSLFLTIAADSFVVTRISSTGERLRQYVRRPPVEASVGPSGAPEPGPICLTGSGLTYANPWRYELVEVDLAPGARERTRRYRSNLLRPLQSGQARATRGGGILGLVCTPSHSIFGYIDLQTGLIHYDLFGGEGESLGRWRFSRDRGGDYPGFLVAMRGNKVLAFRSRPFPHASVWVLEPQGR
jgi:hypothetical protein